MKQILLSAFAATFTLCFALEGQSANHLNSEMKAAYNSVKNNLLRSAEKMPEENYSFKPMPEMRTFAQVMDHVAMSQIHSCGALSGEQKSINGEASSKADVVAALNTAFEECDKAFDGLTDANALETIKSPRGERSRVSLLAGTLAHDDEQYGILTVYMRLKGIIPPSSEKPTGK